ncbi:MAG: hypothetical protein ACK4VY_06970 [Brevundimonas sp.]
MRPDHQEFADGAKLAAIAVVSAALTATVVIGAGRSLFPVKAPAEIARQAPALTPVLHPVPSAR